ncbi:MAG: hypothetical protein ABSG65_35120 [Bryobacteraceae bacterium]|jgi:hypothetical protein
MHEIELIGLDGSNLLAYLAALGTLRVLTLAGSGGNVRMSWVDHQGWHPVVHHNIARKAEELLAILEKRICGEESINAAWKIGEDLTLSCSDFGGHMREAAMAATITRRETVDFLSAFGSDVYGAGSKKELMSDTEFRTMSGAGHQHFLGFMTKLAKATNFGHLRRALFQEWDYADDGPSLRWDPADYRPHALRAVDPSKDPIKTMRGANRLAIEALPLFPTAPQARRIRTVAFNDGDAGTGITWPIWDDRLELGTVASLLAASEIQNSASGDSLRPGIRQIFRAGRFTDGKYRNFRPAKAAL